MKKVLLFSGGMDSLVLKQIIKPDVCIYFDMKTPYTKKEIANLDSDVIIDRTFDFKKESEVDVVIPYRNLYMILKALSYGDKIYFGAMEGDYNTDKTPRFFELLREFLEYLHSDILFKNREVEIITPLINKSKSESIEMFLKSGGEVQELFRSISCHNEKDGHCGDCLACLRKFVAFETLGIDSRKIFIKDIMKNNLWKSEILGAKNRGKEGQEILDVYKKNK